MNKSSTTFSDRWHSIECHLLSQGGLVQNIPPHTLHPFFFLGGGGSQVDSVTQQVTGSCLYILWWFFSWHHFIITHFGFFPFTVLTNCWQRPSPPPPMIPLSAPSVQASLKKKQPVEVVLECLINWNHLWKKIFALSGWALTPSFRPEFLSAPKLNTIDECSFMCPFIVAETADVFKHLQVMLTVRRWCWSSFSFLTF